MRKTFCTSLFFSTGLWALVEFIAKLDFTPNRWLKVAVIYTYLTLFPNVTYAHEISSGWGGVEIGMSVGEAKNKLSKICNDPPSSGRMIWGGCGNFEGEEIWGIELKERGLPFFKKVSSIELSFKYRNGLFKKILRELNHSEFTESPYCQAYDEDYDVLTGSGDRYRDVPFSLFGKFPDLDSCKATFAEGRVHVSWKNYKNRPFKIVSIKYRDID